MQKACLNFIGGLIHSGDNLDRFEWTAQASLHIAKAQSEAEIRRRFVGGSAGNHAVLGNPRQLVHGMQSAQSRINTGNCASR